MQVLVVGYKEVIFRSAVLDSEFQKAFAKAGKDIPEFIFALTLGEAEALLKETREPSELPNLLITELILSRDQLAASAWPPRVDLDAGYRLVSRLRNGTYGLELRSLPVLVLTIRPLTGMRWLPKDDRMQLFRVPIGPRALADKIIGMLQL